MKLNWSTTSEENLSGFGIERSKDGTNWTTLGFVNATGTGGGTTEYMFNDEQPLKGNSFYRLKLTDINPVSKYSEVRTVSIKELTDDIFVMPNPAGSTTNLFVKSSEKKEVAIVIRDMLGRELRRERKQLVTGQNIIPINNLEKLAEGSYLVQILMGEEVYSTKLVKGK